MSEHRCSGCGREFDTLHQVNGHQAQCPARRSPPATAASPAPPPAEPSWLATVAAPALPAAPPPKDDPPAWIGRMPLPDPEPGHTSRRLQNRDVDASEEAQPAPPVAAAPAAAEQLPVLAGAPAAAAPAGPAQPRASVDVFALVRLILDGTAQAAGAEPLSEDEAKLLKASIDDMGWSMSPGMGLAAILATIVVTRAAAHPVVQRAVRRQIDEWLKPGSKGAQVMAGATVMVEQATPAAPARAAVPPAAAPVPAAAPAAAPAPSVDDLWAEEERKWKAQEGES